MIRQCSVEGCQREHAARGFCRAHWKRWKRWGDPTIRRPKKPKITCPIDSCERVVRVNGVCYTHDWRFRTYGSFDLPKRQHVNDVICSVRDCLKQAKAKTLCHMHYSRQRTYGTTEAPPVRKPKNGRKDKRINGMKRKQAQIVVEQKIGRSLLPHEVVHHIDGDPSNDNPENLEVMTRSEHTQHHARERFAYLGNTATHKRCPSCKKMLLREDFKRQPRCPPCARAYEREYYAKRKHILTRQLRQ